MCNGQLISVFFKIFKVTIKGNAGISHVIGCDRNIQWKRGNFQVYCCVNAFNPKEKCKLVICGACHTTNELEAGVEKSQTAIISYGKKAIFELFDGCRPGDLLVIIVGYREQHDFPGYIKEYASTRERPITS